MAKITEEIKEKIIEYYNQGKTNKYIGNELGICSDTVRKVLLSMGIKRQSYIDRLSDEEINEVCQLYLENRFDDIYKKYPFLNKDRIYHIASFKNVKKNSYFWTDEEVDLLKEHYGEWNINDLYLYMNKRHSKKAITTKAIKLNLTKSQEWTENELNILKENYSYIPKEKMLKLLPSRTEASIALKAQNLGIKSYAYLNEKYTEEDKKFIIDNFGVLTDEEIANCLGKTKNGIRDQRYSLGLLYLKKDYSKYTNIMNFFRAHIYEWKEQSMKKCNYCCILTGSKDFEIHHLYSFNSICDEVFSKLEELSKLKSNNIQDYSKEELDEILTIFKDTHNKYPLGICIRKDIHKLFHKIYGQGGNTPEQWYNFVEKYKNKEYC